ncbi:MAG: hydroxyacid dehydrogenase [Micavibrio aeruginosavorus]|uniref:Hydroxyacid dehydrogenase n=1 Tax=Micavibrio aeruginosavorus TaxID=349221 RepID=A0A2W5MTR8_9BACT|nr:MAG: hydroxyacid dehydrogenase [Micavibrio aeruginosavorus]
MPVSTKAYAAQSKTSPIAPFAFDRRDPGPKDVAIDIKFCGICHSDVHQVRDEWGGSLYPMVPGHEIVGTVTAVGKDVKKYKVGDTVGVGCMVDSCRECVNCKDNEEQFCVNGFTGTYNAQDKRHGGLAQGGYSQHIVVDEDFVLKITSKADLAAIAPLLCAGITTYSPLKRWKAGPGKKVGIVGLGGLGHMGVKIAVAMGADVTVFTTSQSKVDDAKKLGAHHVILSKDAKQMESAANSFDFILDTVSADHDINAYLNLLKRDGTLTQVGLPTNPVAISLFPLVLKRINFSGSLIGGIKETQEMLDFCAKHDIVSEIELIKADQINEAYDRLMKSDVKYRFVIDTATI